MTSAPYRLKTVHYRGVLVVFQIPEHWTEQYGRDGGGEFFDPDDERLTLRLNVHTFKAPSDLGDNDAPRVLREVHSDLGGSVERLANRQALQICSPRRETNSGIAIDLHPMMLVRVVPPRTVRVASFVASLDARTEYSEKMRSDLAMIHDQVRGAVISDQPPALPWWRRILGV